MLARECLSRLREEESPLVAKKIFKTFVRQSAGRREYACHDLHCVLAGLATLRHSRRAGPSGSRTNDQHKDPTLHGELCAVQIFCKVEVVATWVRAELLILAPCSRCRVGHACRW